MCVCFSFVVSAILSGDSRESVVEKIHTHLTEVGEEVRAGNTPQDMFLITKVTEVKPSYKKPPYKEPPVIMNPLIRNLWL